ncbi:MAG: hypothetical protein GY835_19355 [bacterium]|nr:hypothetical protein [bacterium]
MPKNHWDKTVTRGRAPARVVENVLLRSRRRCPVCYATGNRLVQEGNIVHLDHDPSNNEEDNLVFLCFAHHEALDSQRSLTPGFVREARSRLYSDIEKGTVNGTPQGLGMQYEELVAGIVKKDLARALGERSFTVYQGRLYPGRSGTRREVDIAAEITLAGIRLLIIFEIKRIKRKMGAAEIYQLLGLLDDISADKGVFVSSSGFSAEAIRVAASKGVTLVVIEEDMSSLEEGVIETFTARTAAKRLD